MRQQFIISGIIGVIADTGTVIAGNDLLNGWLCVIIICAVLLAILFCKSPEETREEIKAKFSIQ